MSPKAAKTSKPVAKKEVKAAAPAKKAGKASKAAAIEEGEELPLQMASADDQEELEEQADEAASSSAGGGGNDAALAAAVAGGTEMSASLKNFRHHPDMENFYTFIFENDLRHEALAIIDTMQLQKQTRKLIKGAKAQAH